MTPISQVTVEVSSGDITVEPGTGTETMVTTSGVHGLTYPTDEEHVVGHTLVIRSSCGTRSSTIDATGTMYCTALRGGSDRQFR